MLLSAMKWTYGAEAMKLGLKASELAMLRAICWKTDTRLGYCPELTDSDLSVLTGYTGRQTFTNARKHLRSLNLLSYEHENRASDRYHDDYGSSNGYVYYLHLGCPTTR